MSINRNKSNDKNQAIDLIGIKTPIIYTDKFEQTLVRHLLKKNPKRYNQFHKFVVRDNERKLVWLDLKKRERLHITRHYSKGAELNDSQEIVAIQFINKTIRKRDVDCRDTFNKLKLETP